MKICCVCTGNTCRSPMLELLLRRELESLQPGWSDENELFSAGLAAAPGHSASEHAITCMKQRGLDLRGHRSQPIEPEWMRSVHHFYCLTPRHAEVLMLNGVPIESLQVVNADNGGVPDPYGGSLEDYQGIAEIIEIGARLIANQIIHNTKDKS